MQEVMVSLQHETQALKVTHKFSTLWM